jgi:Tfp pilus assembly protein PilP
MREQAEEIKAQAMEAKEEWKKEQQHLQEEMEQFEVERQELNGRIKHEIEIEVLGDQGA